ALFYHTLAAMKAHGYAYAVIGSAGPVDFYANAVGAIAITSSADGNDVYQGMLRLGRKPDGTD
ncbi:hypothetical protein, partial [Pseudomonas sp. AH2 (2023)]|uniref:hypothetical protein n=1 Tax=Pseudomonas sp. AH2 (2023) TaxID=3048599 RepID=UPI002B222A77